MRPTAYSDTPQKVILMRDCHVFIGSERVKRTREMKDKKEPRKKERTHQRFVEMNETP